MATESGLCANPLHVACIQSDPNIVSALIREGCDVNAEVGRIDIYLNSSTDLGNTSAAQCSLEQGTVANNNGNGGKTPTVAATRKKKPKKKCVNDVRILDFSRMSVNTDAMDGFKEKSTYMTNKNLPVILSFLFKKGADGGIVDLHGCAPLDFDCFKNLVGVITRLIELKVDLYKLYALYDTPLLVVVIRGIYKETLSVLIDDKSDMNMLMVNGSTTALHSAVEECNLGKVTHLVDLGADLKKQLSNGKTPLHALAARARSEDVAEEKTNVQASFSISEFLVEKGADVNAADGQKSTPLSLAVSNEDLELAKQFIKLGANVNLPLASGKITFHNIASLNHDIIILSLEYGGDYNEKNNSGFTPYHTAITANVDVKFIKSFVQFGCPYNQEVSTWNRSKRRATNECRKFFKAEEQFFKGIEQNDLKLVCKAVGEGAVPIGCSEGCRYPLHFVASKGFQKLLTYLLENAFPANALNDKGETALFVAAKQGHYDICCTLLEYGACYNYCSIKCPKTPKMIAAEFEHETIVELLKSVGRLFFLASTNSKCLVKQLKKIFQSSQSKYLMHAKAINTKGDTLLSTVLHSQNKEDAQAMMEIYVKANT